MKRSVESLLPSYYELIQSLFNGCLGFCVLDGELIASGSRGSFDPESFIAWIQHERRQGALDVRLNIVRRRTVEEFEIALGLVDSTEKLIAVVGIALTEAQARSLGVNPASMLRQRLTPALDCLHRELASAARSKTKVATLSERTRDLEWLFEVAADMKSAGTNRAALEKLLASGSQRMSSAFCALIVPGQRLLVQHTAQPAAVSVQFERIRTDTQAHLLAWAQKHRRPLVMNKAGTAPSKIAPCKLLSVPVAPRQGPALGVLLFINPPSAEDYIKRQIFLAAHIARQAAQLLQSQYDLATGLLTRAALEETYASLPEQIKLPPQSVLQIDIDRLHVVNDIHGFSAGDDIIVRVANMLAPPILPRDALVARISGDQFVTVLPSCDTHAAASLAAQLQRAAKQTPLGTLPAGIELTLSCGITTLNNDRSGLAAALVSANAACQAAKDRGRNRIETYACDDFSIIQRHDDALKLGSLEEALKSDRFQLFAQAIVPLQNPELAGGYEVLLRLRNQDNSVGGPGDFLSAAQRYQMMPSIDRWVLDHTLSLLESYAGVLLRRGISVSINVTGHSLADDSFVDYLLARTKSSRFPPRLLTIEITEQSAVRNLARAVQLMKRLRAAGCGVALDDFGTGTNSLAYLRDLPITRVKIDGSFVKDILTNRRAASTLGGIVDLVRPFDVETVAEYVENESLARIVKSLGIDYAQGYAFGKPEAMESIFEGLKLDESRKMRRLALEI